MMLICLKTDEHFILNVVWQSCDFLAAEEAAEYSNIGINKIDTLLKQHNCPLALYVDIRRLAKRKEFEGFISREIVV